MPIQGTVPITTLERAVSDDVNQLQALVNRSIDELAACLTRTTQWSTNGGSPATAIRSHVASGLSVDVAATGLTVEVQPGMLLQSVTPSPPAVPTPDTFDSSYRFGLQLAVEDVGDPWDATSAWWLLQGRVERVTTLSEVRDIYNPATGLFAPSAAAIDKRYESQVAYAWKKGTATDLPLPDAGYAPIGWCYRPIGGGLITTGVVGSMSVQVEDLSPETFDLGRCVRHRFLFKDDWGIGIAGTATAYWDWQAEVAGCRVYSRTPIAGGTLFKSAAFIVAADAVALDVAFTWGYFYLAPLPDACPKKEATGVAGVRQNGILILSRTPPDQFGTNSVAITPPPPWTNYVIPIGGAAHVGLFQSNGVGATANTIHVSESGLVRCFPRQFNNNNMQLNQGNGFIGPVGSPTNLAVAGPGGTEDVPYGVRILAHIQHDFIPVAPPVAAALEVTVGMGPAVTMDLTTLPTAWPRMLLSTISLEGGMRFELWPHAGDLNLRLTFIPRTIAMANSGGGAGDGVGVAMSLWYHGFQF